MKNLKLKQFVSLREQLLRDKADLEARLAEINKALGLAKVVVAAAPAAAEPKAAVATEGRAKRAPRAGGGRKRVKNTIALRDAVLQVTKAKPLSRQEILEAVKGLGYVFAAKDPLNSLSTLLYTDKGIKNNGGKFGPA